MISNKTPAPKPTPTPTAVPSLPQVEVGCNSTPNDDTVCCCVDFSLLQDVAGG